MIADSVTRVAALMGDAARARMLVALIDNVELRASDLARYADVSAQTTSFHLAKLCEARLLTMAKRGRARLYALSGPHVAAAVEALMAVVPNGARDRRQLKSIELARTCYDHLAGRAGVALADGLIRGGWLDVAGGQFTVTPHGETGLHAFGIDTADLHTQRRQFAKRCLDWTERRYHVAGALGAALTDGLLRRKWIVRLPKSRVVHVTAEGHRGLRRVFGAEV